MATNVVYIAPKTPPLPRTTPRVLIDAPPSTVDFPDTIGRVERASVDIQRATHAGFARAVQERLAALRFVPARVRGHAVRQLVEEGFHFEVVRC